MLLVRVMGLVNRSVEWNLGPIPESRTISAKRNKTKNSLVSKTTPLQSIIRGEGERVGVQETRGKRAEGGNSRRVASGKRAVPRIITPLISNNPLCESICCNANL